MTRLIRYVLVAAALAVASCAAEPQTEASGAAGSAAPAVDVRADQFEVGVSSQALTKSWTTINTEDGAEIPWTNNLNKYSGLRCWMMQLCPSYCSGSSFHCSQVSGNWQCTGANQTVPRYVTSGCTSTKCNVVKTLNGSGTTVGSFTFVAGSGKIFSAATAPGYASGSCTGQSGYPTLTLSN